MIAQTFLGSGIYCSPLSPLSIMMVDSLALEATLSKDTQPAGPTSEAGSPGIPRYDSGVEDLGYYSSDQPVRGSIVSGLACSLGEEGLDALAVWGRLQRPRRRPVVPRAAPTRQREHTRSLFHISAEDEAECGLVFLEALQVRREMGAPWGGKRTLTGPRSCGGRWHL
jgi:hypothetical protein